MHHHAYGRASYGLSPQALRQAGWHARTIILSRLRGAASQPSGDPRHCRVAAAGHNNGCPLCCAQACLWVQQGTHSFDSSSANLDPRFRKLLVSRLVCLALISPGIISRDQRLYKLAQHFRLESFQRSIPWEPNKPFVGSETEPIESLPRFFFKVRLSETKNQNSYDCAIYFWV